MGGRKPKDASEVLDALLEALAEDVWTEAYSDEDIDRELREAGGDPDEIGREGAELVARLLERRRRVLEAEGAENGGAEGTEQKPGEED